MRRREQREHIFKLLFMTGFNTPGEMEEQLSLYFDGLEGEELQEKDKEYIQEKYRHVMEHIEEIDRKLNETSRGWKTKRMSRVDLAALRVAVYEMDFDQDVPVGVAINEAVELAKRYGGETSGSFVNGILGKAARGESAGPEEDQKPKRGGRNRRIENKDAKDNIIRIVNTEEMKRTGKIKAASRPAAREPLSSEAVCEAKISSAPDAGETEEEAGKDE